MASMAATSARALLFLIVVVPVALAAETTTHEAHLNFFMHNNVVGSNPTAVRVVEGPATTDSSSVGMSFGDTSVIDDPLTETSSATSAAVGRAQGLFMVSSQTGPVLTVCVNLVLTAGEYSGSTVAIMGRLDDTPAAMEDASVRELAVVGGTGAFRKATGHVLWKITRMEGPNAVIELDVYVTMVRKPVVEICSFGESSS